MMRTPTHTPATIVRVATATLASLALAVTVLIAPPATADVGDNAAQVLAQLDVQKKNSSRGYKRSKFGSGWGNSNTDPCDTRSDILKRDLSRYTVPPRDVHECMVLTGVLEIDPYTGEQIVYERGGASEIDIDHVVALSASWGVGAKSWNKKKRRAFANDPLNLLAVDAGANRSKGDKDASRWLPENTSFQCDYVARQIAVKDKYDLAITRAEKRAMTQVLDTCPTEKIPGPTSPNPTAGNNDTGSGDSAPGGDPATTPGAGSDATYYATCAAAREAGVTPIVKGTPLYDANTHLDRDKDGRACE